MSHNSESGLWIKFGGQNSGCTTFTFQFPVFVCELILTDDSMIYNFFMQWNNGEIDMIAAMVELDAKNKSLWIEVSL